jgi:hypothetical protein
VEARRDRSGRHNIILAAFASREEPLLANQDPDITVMLAGRLSAPSAAQVSPLTDDYAPVDRYIMSAW